MTNRTDQYKVFRYYEGLCSSGDFPREIARVLCLGCKDGGVPVPGYNWDIVFPKPDQNYDAYYNDKGIMTDGVKFKEKVDEQVAKIQDTVILKTRTDEKDTTGLEDDLTVDVAQNEASLVMYLEIYKPAYIADPEKYPLDCERSNIIPEVITRGLYEKQFKSLESREDEVYKATKKIDGSTIAFEPIEDDSNTDIVRGVSESELETKLADLGRVTQEQYAVAQAKEDTGLTIVLSKENLANIKKSYNDLYKFLCNTMQIEAAEYTYLDNVTFFASTYTEGDASSIQIRETGRITRKKYKFPAGSVFKTQKVPYEANPKLELRLNGIYTPINADYYDYDETTHTFTFKDRNEEAKKTDSTLKDDIFEYEEISQGTLVCRYSIQVKNPDDTTSKMDLIKEVTDRETIINNHYVLMRLFDNINAAGDAPLENTYNSKGEIIEMRSHVSDWSKLSWYRDFEEVMLDHLDEDVSTSTITDGSVLVPIETPGLNSDTKIRYWINTNNNRFSLIVMGNPSLDYNTDRHLVSACYCGAIDSFDNSINDTAGNFALFTSSSTEPCSTVLSVEKKTVHDLTSKSGTEAEPAYTVTGVINSPKEGIVIELPNGEYFDRTSWPQVCFDTNDEGEPHYNINNRADVKAREYEVVDGKSSVVVIDLNVPEDFTYSTLYLYADTFKEENVISSGVSRDVFGNTVNVVKTSSYGKNTSDGVTSIMMYHTRSKAYYQKHHMLFATTEEYMSKVMYGKSMYTGEYYADRIKVTHGNDGPRGILSDLLVIDSASLYALDELVINKDFEKDAYENEETFIYFPITAPFSPLSDSPNATYGLAIKKSEKEPGLATETDLLKKAFGQIDSTYRNIWSIVSTEFAPIAWADAEDLDGNHPLVYWKVVDGTSFKEVNGTKIDDAYVPIKLCVVDNNNEYVGEGANLTDVYLNGSTPTITVTAGSTKTDVDKINSYIKIAGFAPNDLTDDEGQAVSGEYENIYYGISDTKVTNIKNGRNIVVALNDGSTDDSNPAETFKYNVYGIPYTGQLDASKIPADKSTTPTNEVAIVDAAPDKYLVLYSGKVKSDGSIVISKFANVPLKNPTGDANALLQYPSEVTIISNNGKFYLRGENVANANDILSLISQYDETISIVCVPNDGYEIDNIKVFKKDGTTEINTYDINDAVASADSEETNNGYESSETAEKAAGYPIFQLDGVKEVQHITVSFKPVTE